MSQVVAGIVEAPCGGANGRVGVADPDLDYPFKGTDLDQPGRREWRFKEVGERRL